MAEALIPGALWLTTNTLCIITIGSLGPLIDMSTRKIGMVTSARHRKSVEGRARFSGGRSAAGSGFRRGQREHDPKHGSAEQQADHQQRSDCPQSAACTGGPRN